MRIWAVAGVVMLSAGCAARPSAPMNDLVFLTRDGCVQTDRMRANLDTALKATNQPATYQIVDLGTLKGTDTRTGYPTPTLLRGGRDVFGMPEPIPPFPDPT